MLLPLERGIVRSLRDEGIELDWTDGTQPVDPLVAAAADLVLGECAPDEVRAAATTPVVGCGADSLRSAIATYQPPNALFDDSDPGFRDLVRQFFERQGHPATPAGAVAMVCCLLLRRVADGAVHPVVGARALAWYGMWGQYAPGDAVTIFDRLFAEWLVDPSTRPAAEALMRDRAGMILRSQRG